MSNNINYVQSGEQLNGENGLPAEIDSLNRPLKELVTLIENGRIDGYSSKFSNVLVDNNEFLAGVATGDLVMFDDVTGKYILANFTTGNRNIVGFADLTNSIIHNRGRLSLPAYTFTVGKFYHLDSANDGKLVISTDANADAVIAGFAISTTELFVQIDYTGDTASFATTAGTAAFATEAGHSLTSDDSILLGGKLPAFYKNAIADNSPASIIQDPDTTIESLIVTAHANGPTGALYYIKTEFFGDKLTTADRLQTAFDYNNGDKSFVRRFLTGSWSPWVPVTEIIDNLSSTSITAGLSANQGKLLDENKLSALTDSTEDTDPNTTTKTLIYGTHVNNPDATNPYYVKTFTRNGTLEKFQEAQISGNIEGAIFSGTNFGTLSENPSMSGITFDGTNFWIVGVGGIVYKYDSAGAYTGTSFSVATQAPAAVDITYDGTDLWILNPDSVYKFNTAGTYLAITFSTNTEDNNMTGITHDGTDLWLAGNTSNSIYQYNTSGVLQSSFSVASEDLTTRGLSFDGTDLWMMGGNSEKAFKYTTSGIYTETSFSVASEDTDTWGIVSAGNSFWIVGGATDNVYKYDANSDKNSRFIRHSTSLGDWGLWRDISGGNIGKHIPIAMLEMNANGTAKSISTTNSQFVGSFLSGSTYTINLQNMDGQTNYHPIITKISSGNAAPAVLTRTPTSFTYNFVNGVANVNIPDHYITIMKIDS